MMTYSRPQQYINVGACTGKIVSMLLFIVICILQQNVQSFAQTNLDELALNNFRSFVTNDPNNAFGSWDQSVDVCEWSHVICKDNERVISLDLSNQGLVGTISASLGALEFLEDLNLENNSFTGAIPVTLGYLTHLRTLNFGNNHLKDPLATSGQMIRDIHARQAGLTRESDKLAYVLESSFTLQASKGYDDRIARVRFLQGGEPGQKKQKHLPLILGVVGGVMSFLLLCISSVFLWKWYTKARNDQKPDLKPASRVPVHISSKKLHALSEKARKSTKSFTIQELKTATEDFSLKNVIGEGGFGLVFKGTLSTGQGVAIKHAHKNAQQGLDEFYNEVELLSKVHHKYLVDLIGYCDEGGEQLLVYEFIPNGNLFEHLCGQRTPALTWRQRVHIAICCAKGLAHLHEGCSPSIIHRDIKPTNNRRFPDVKSSSRQIQGHVERAAINTPVQGSAADVAMCAMIEINRSKVLKDLGWKLLLQVHDEVILEGPSESAAVAKDEVVKCMCFPFGGKNNLKVALAVDAKFAQSWYAAK